MHQVEQAIDLLLLGRTASVQTASFYSNVAGLLAGDCSGQSSKLCIARVNIPF